MVRTLYRDYIEWNKSYCKLAGLSTDTKPVDGIVTGSEFFEVNTGKTYYFDEEGDTGSEWVDPTAT